MACNVSEGRLRVCRTNVGGLQKVYLAVGDDFATGTTIAGGLITALGTASVYEYDLESQYGFGSFSSEPQISNENHTLFYQNSVMMKLPNLEPLETQELHDQLQSNNLWVFALDQQGQIWVLQDARGVTAPFGTGEQMGDFSGTTVTFQNNSKTPPYALTYNATPFGAAGFSNITIVPGL